MQHQPREQAIARLTGMHAVTGRQISLPSVSYTHLDVYKRQDLVLWVRIDAESWHAVAHVRPTTGQTVHVKDQVGARASVRRAKMLQDSFATQRVLRLSLIHI